MHRLKHGVVNELQEESEKNAPLTNSWEEASLSVNGD